MIYVKSILAGLLAAILSIASLEISSIYSRMREQTAGIGAVAVGTEDFSWITLVLVGVILFAAGFVWQFRKLRKRLPKN